MTPSLVLLLIIAKDLTLGQFDCNAQIQIMDCWRGK